MTKKHFEILARVIASIDDGADRAMMQRAVTDIGKELNERFSHKRFKARVAELHKEYLDTYAEEILPLEAGDDGPEESVLIDALKAIVERLENAEELESVLSAKWDAIDEAKRALASRPKDPGIPLSMYLADYLVEESIVPDRMGETVHDALENGIEAYQGGAR